MRYYLFFESSFLFLSLDRVVGRVESGFKILFKDSLITLSAEFLVNNLLVSVDFFREILLFLGVLSLFSWKLRKLSF